MIWRWLALAEIIGILAFAPRVWAGAGVATGGDFANAPTQTGNGPEVVLTGTPANFLMAAFIGAGVPNTAPNPAGRLEQRLSALRCTLGAAAGSVPTCQFNDAAGTAEVAGEFNTAIFTALTWVEAVVPDPATRALTLAAVDIRCGRFPHDSDSAQCRLLVDPSAVAGSRRRQLVLKPTLVLPTAIAATLLEGFTSAGVFNLADSASPQRVLQDLGAVACIRRGAMQEVPLCVLFERGRLRLATATTEDGSAMAPVPVASVLYGALAEQAGVLADAGAELSLSAATEVVCSRNFYTPGATNCYLSPVALLQPSLSH